MISIFNYNLCQGLISDWVRHEINKKRGKSLAILLHCKNNFFSILWFLQKFYEKDASEHVVRARVKWLLSSQNNDDFC